MSPQEDVLISPKDTKERIGALGDPSSNDTACLIFGAGASFGYSELHQLKPPIVRDLFDVQNNLTVRAVINRPEHLSIKNNSEDFIRGLSRYENDLERYLSYLYSQDSEDNLFNKLLNYIEDIFFLASENIIQGEPNNYKTLINHMRDLHRRKKWSCISFNYDTILEKSYLMANRDVRARIFSSVESYIASNPVILKMHGSVNFRYVTKETTGEFTPHDLFSKMMTDNRSSHNFFKVINVAERKPQFFASEFAKGIGGKLEKVYSYNFPLMLLPLHASVRHENTFFKKMLELAREQIEKSSLIIAIGYNFGDLAFVQSLGNVDFSKKEIILVGTYPDVNKLQNHRAFQSAKTAFPNTKVRIFKGNGFNDFVNTI